MPVVLAKRRATPHLICPLRQQRGDRVVKAVNYQQQCCPIAPPEVEERRLLLVGQSFDALRNALRGLGPANVGGRLSARSEMSAIRFCARSGVADDRPALERQQEAADAVNHAVVHALRRLHCDKNLPSRLGALLVNKHQQAGDAPLIPTTEASGMRHCCPAPATPGTGPMPSNRCSIPVQSSLRPRLLRIPSKLFALHSSTRDSGADCAPAPA